MYSVPSSNLWNLINFLDISLGNPKILRINLEFNKKIKKGDIYRMPPSPGIALNHRCGLFNEFGYGTIFALDLRYVPIIKMYAHDRANNQI